MNITDPSWENTIKEVDPKFEGSIYQQLGLSDIICPTCAAHCKVTGGELICLNACHLMPEAQKMFHKLWLLATGASFENVIPDNEEGNK